MNEKIRELSRQTTEELLGMYPHRERWQEKFAELIIEECAKIAQDCYTYHEPLSKVPEHIKKFERLNDENMRNKL